MKLAITIDGKEIVREVVQWNGVFKTLPLNKRFHVWAAPCALCKTNHRSRIVRPITKDDHSVLVELNNDCYRKLGNVGLQDFPDTPNVYIEVNNCKCPEDHPHNNRGCYMGLCSCRESG